MVTEHFQLKRLPFTAEIDPAFMLKFASFNQGDLRLQAGALEASGAMEVGDALRVRGHAVAELRNAARPFRTDLSVGGQLSELTLTP